MKKVLILLSILLFTGNALANFSGDFNISFDAPKTTEPPAIETPPEVEPPAPTITEINIQYVAEGDFKKYLIDPVKLTAYQYDRDFLTRDFYFYKALEPENKLFHETGATPACTITIYQLDLAGNQIDATSTDTDSILGFNLGKGDETYLAIAPTAEGTCRIQIDETAYIVDFRRVDSAKQYISKYKFPCGKGIFCFTLPNGEQVNVTEWESLDCSFDSMRQGNEACKDELLDDERKKSEDLNAQLAEAKSQSEPALAEKLDNQDKKLDELKEGQLDINDFIYWVIVGVPIALIIAVSIVGAAKIMNQSKRPRVRSEMQQYFEKAEDVRKIIESEEERFTDLKKEKEETESNGNTG